MASRYRKIDPRIWTDEKFRRLTADEQRIALYILTAQSNRIGLFSFSPGKACEDLRTSPAKFSKAFIAVCKILKWEWDQGARVLYLPTWWRYNAPESANNVVGNLKDLDDLPATPLLEKFASNTIYLSDTVKQTFTQTVSKWPSHPSPKPSPYPSPTQEQEQEQEQEQDPPPAVDHQFEEFWKAYPMRDGRRIGKPEALKKWSSLSAPDRKRVLIAVQHYANSNQVLAGIGIKDPHRWLRKGKKDEPWREWLEPEQAPIRNGHDRAPACTKPVQGQNDCRWLPCGQPASPESRPTEPRCPEHLRAASQPQMVNHVSH